MEVNLMTNVQFCVELDKAIDRQFQARTRNAKEDAANEVKSLIFLRANGNKKIEKQWMLHYDGRISQAYG